jgi:hypothetical protein
MDPVSLDLLIVDLRRQISETQDSINAFQCLVDQVKAKYSSAIVALNQMEENFKYIKYDAPVVSISAYRDILTSVLTGRENLTRLEKNIRNNEESVRIRTKTLGTLKQRLVRMEQDLANFVARPTVIPFRTPYDTRRNPPAPTE